MTLHPQGWRPKSWSRRTSPPRKTSDEGGGPASPGNSKGNKEVQVFPASREELAETATWGIPRETPSGHEPPSALRRSPSLSDKGPTCLRQPLWQEHSAPAGWWSASPGAIAAAPTFSRSRVPLVQPSTLAEDSAAGSSPKPGKTSASLHGRQQQLPPAQPAETTVRKTAWRAKGRLARAIGPRMGPAVGPIPPFAGPFSVLAVGAILRRVRRRATLHLVAFSSGASVALA